MEDIEDIDTASSHRDTLSHCPPGHPNRSSFLMRLANALKTLKTRYEWSVSLMNFVNALFKFNHGYQHYQQSDRMEDLEDAISSARDVLSLCHPDHRSKFLINVANALMARYEQSGRMEDLEVVISSDREALSLCSPGHTNRSMCLTNFATALLTRYQRSRRMEDLEDAISSHREALTGLRPSGHLDRFTSLMNFANSLKTRYERSGRMEDLEDAISSHRNALSLCPPGHSNRSISLMDLANALLTRYQQSGRMEDLEDVISSHREALSLCPPDHPDCSLSLMTLANALMARYERSGRMDDVEDAISSHRKAISLCPPDHPNHSMFLTSLAPTLLTHYEQSGRMEDLEDVISSYRNILSLCPPGYPNRPIFLMNIGSALLTRYQRSGKMEDLEDGISSHCNALSLCPPGHPDRSMSLMNLATTLLIRYERSGRMEDLGDAISSHREALSLCPPGHPYRSNSLISLANALFTRYERSGRVEDLEDAFSSHRNALSLCPPGHPDHSMSLMDLAQNHKIRYEQSGRIVDLEDAISSHRNALSFCSPSHTDHSMSLMSLTQDHKIRYQQSGRIEDLEDVISSHRNALSLCPPGHPNRSIFLMSFGSALLTRYEQSGRMEDLEDVISSHREALGLCPPGHPNRSRSLMNIAHALFTRYQRSGTMDDCHDTFVVYEQAASDIMSPPQHRLSAAMCWVIKAQDCHHSSFFSACKISLQLLNRCLISHPDVESQQKFLATAGIPRSLASEFACASIYAGDLELAVELLEQGRAMVWSQVDAYRYPLEQLRQVEGGVQLADCLGRLNAELEHLVLLSESRSLDSEISTGALSLEDRMRRHRILSAEWEDVVGRIRKIEHFDNFLQAVPFNTLQSAAAEGPVILINISSDRSDAIILRINSSPVLVPLPKVQSVDLSDQAKKLGSARGIITVLRKLWVNIVSPVVERLTELGVQEKSRIWWCPTCELCGLPLHAAGPYQPRQRNLPDIYTSSYISTLSALIRARSNISAPSSVPKLLVVGQPEKTLRKVQEEVDNLRQLGDFVNVIIGPEANREAVLDGLKQHSWAHFACHGHLGDNAQPFHASFELHDGRRLTLLDLIQARLPNAELAFLSACYSAAGDIPTPDETIHLSAALQFCGFRSVVGTLWEMVDEDGPTISKEFYKYMFRDPGKIADFRDSAQALNSAIRAARKNGVPLDRWVMFAHIGA